MRILTAAVPLFTLLLACGAWPGAIPSSGQVTRVPQPGRETPRLGFERTLELQGVRFRVSCSNDSPRNVVTIQPAGLEIVNSPVMREVDGMVTGAEVADLDGNGSPEIYAYATSAGSGSYGTVVAFAANNRKSLSEIYLPAITEDKEASQGYLGHDTFAVAGSFLVRRFPIYREGDPNARPTGGTRSLRYSLAAGEAGWTLELESMVDSTP